MCDNYEMQDHNKLAILYSLAGYDHSWVGEETFQFCELFCVYSPNIFLFLADLNDYTIGNNKQQEKVM